MRLTRAYIILGISSAMLLFASCGKQHKAESIIEDFISVSATDPDKITNRDFADLGTTRHITDSLIDVMRKRGADNYKKDISYCIHPSESGDLYYLRMSYVYEGDTLQNTFYLNKTLTDVVAFK